MDIYHEAKTALAPLIRNATDEYIPKEVIMYQIMHAADELSRLMAAQGSDSEYDISDA